MRLRRLAPATAGVLREAVLADPGALMDGLQWLATDLPVPGNDAVEALGVDGRGRLVVVAVAADADAAAIERALGHWRWLCAALPAIRSLAPAGGVDFAAEPRVAIAAARVPSASLHLVSSIGRPRVELYVAALVTDGERQGLLVEPAMPDAATPDAAPPGQWTPALPAARAAGATHAGPPRSFAGPAGMPRTIGAAEPVELTQEEIAEFRKLGARPADTGGATAPADPHDKAAGAKFVEN